MNSTMPVRRRRRTALIALLLATAVTAAGCQSDSSNDSGDSGDSGKKGAGAQQEAVGQGKASAGAKRDSLFAGPELEIGVKEDQPGTGYKSQASGKQSGFDIQVASYVGKALGFRPLAPEGEKELELHDVDSDDRVSRLSDGNLDLVIATFSITSERDDTIDFVGPYATTRQGFLVREDGPHINTDADLGGVPVCVWEGTTSAAELRRIKGKNAPEVHEYRRASECLDALKGGRVDAVSTDQLILYGYASSDKYKGLEVSKHTLGTINYYGIGLPEKFGKDCERLKGIVREYIESDEWMNDIRNELPALQEMTSERLRDSFQPDARDMGSRSCQD